VIHPDLEVGNLCRFRQTRPKAPSLILLYSATTRVDLISTQAFRKLTVNSKMGPFLYLGPDLLSEQIHIFWYDERKWFTLDLDIFEVVPWP